MQPKKDVLLTAQQQGTIYILNRILSANHLLLAMSDDMVAKAEDIMEGTGLKMGSLKQSINKYHRVAEAYFHEFAEMVPPDMVNPFFRDLQQKTDEFCKWAEITDEDIERIKQEYASKKISNG